MTVRLEGRQSLRARRATYSDVELDALGQFFRLQLTSESSILTVANG